jgi:hypothetical protein
MKKYFENIMKTRHSIKVLILLMLSIFSSYQSFSQETDSTNVAVEEPKKNNRPVKDMFESACILNTQTTEIPTANTLEFMIQHRFGKLNSEEFDLLGMYAPSNIRIGLSYSLTNNLLVGFGTTKNNKLQDLNWKYAIVKQTRSGSMPLSVSYYGNVAVDARSDMYPKITNRLSYYHQLILARKINKSISVQLSPSYSYFNTVDSLIERSGFGLSFSGRVKVREAMSVVFEYDQHFTKQVETLLPVKPNLSLGIETATSAHVFQIFIGTADAIMNQYNEMYNTNDFTKKDLLIGFNITRLWNL